MESVTIKAKNAPNQEAKSPRPIMRLATILNIGYGAFEAFVGGSTGSSAAFANGFHNAADGASHAAHTATHVQESKGHQSQTVNNKKVQNRRRLAAGAILVGAMVTGYHAVDGFNDANEAESLNTHALATEVGAVAINGTLIFLIKRRKDGSVAYYDALRHHKVDGAIASVTSASVYLNQFLPYTDSVGGLVGTGASMALAYTYLKNKDHSDA